MGFTSQAGQLVIVEQSAPGVFSPDLATKGVGVKLRSGSFGTNRELLVPDPEIGGGRDTSDAYLGAVSWSADFEFYARMDALATFLKGVLGTAVPAVTAGGVSVHEINPSDAGQLPFFSVQESIGNGLEAYTYTDVVVNSLSLSADANGYLICSVNLIGRRQEAGVTPVAAPKWDNTPLIVGTNILVTYNSVVLPAKSFSLEINNNFEDDDFRLGSFYLGDLTPKSREVTSSFNLRHANSAMWRSAVYGSEAATVPGGLTVKAPLNITAKTYEPIPGSSPETPYGVSFDFPSFVLSPFSFEASGDDILENDVEGRALRPDPSVGILKAKVTTEKATIS